MEQGTINVLVMTGAVIIFLGLIGYAVYLIFFKKSGSQTAMQLKNYIATYTAQGYQLESLRQSLISQGYSQKDIDQAIDLYQKGG